MHLLETRRQQVVRSMDSGSILVLFSGSLQYETQDETYPFSVNRNFYYLTNIAESNCILVLFERSNVIQEHLFIERTDEVMAKWVGRNISAEAATAASGIKQIHYIDEFDGLFARWLLPVQKPAVYLDLQRLSMNAQDSDSHRFAARLKQLYPQLDILQAHPILTKHRLTKGEDEVEAISKAIVITNLGIERMMKTVHPGMKEYQLEAEFNYALLQEGCRKTAFKTIVASGVHGTVLHYNDNNAEIQEEQLVLCDLGASYGMYNADITRTFPALGKFTNRQRELYEVVLEANEEVIKHAKAGTTLRQLNQIVIQLYQKRLEELGLLENGKTVFDYYYHGVSHMLGLDTHDVSLPDYCLEPGNIITVEPGLYIEEEKIGIRIEDDVLITADEPINLSKQIIKQIDEIEAFMNQR